jgi:hypothetical protein
MIDRDRLNNASPAAVASCAAALADVLQDRPIEVRVLGVAAFTKLFFERLGIPPQDAMTASGNLMAEAERLGVRGFSGLRDYLSADF